MGRCFDPGRISCILDTVESDLARTGGVIIDSVGPGFVYCILGSCLLYLILLLLWLPFRYVSQRGTSIRNEVELLFLPIKVVELLLRFVFLGSWLHFKISRATARVKSFINESGYHSTGVIFYGATELDPQNLAIHFMFKTNAEIQAVRKNDFEKTIIAQCKEKLAEAGYPQKAFEGIYIGIESDENVENGGGVHYYFQ